MRPQVGLQDYSRASGLPASPMESKPPTAPPRCPHHPKRFASGGPSSACRPLRIAQSISHSTPTLSPSPPNPRRGGALRPPGICVVRTQRSRPHPRSQQTSESPKSSVRISDKNDGSWSKPLLKQTQKHVNKSARQCMTGIKGILCPKASHQRRRTSCTENTGPRKGESFLASNLRAVSGIRGKKETTSHASYSIGSRRWDVVFE